MKKKFIGLIVIILLVCGYFLFKDSLVKTITFDATIKEVYDNSILVETTDTSLSFDIASVDIRDAKIEGNLKKGSKVTLIIEDLIRESYPVQVTAIKVIVNDK